MQQFGNLESEKRQERNEKRSENNQNHLEDRIKDFFKINDLTEEDDQSTFGKTQQKRAQTSHNFNKKNAMNQSASNKQFNPILKESANITKSGNKTSTGFFNINRNKMFSSTLPKNKSARYDNKYISDMENFGKTSLSKANKSKGYDGFESYNIPRVGLRSKSEMKENSLVDNYSRQMANSIKLGSKQCSNANSVELNQLCEEENKKLRNVIKNQLNGEYLAKAKLPKISYIVNQPKFNMANSRTQYNKNMGAKFNPFNYQTDRSSKTFGRNIFGGTFNH